MLDKKRGLSCLIFCLLSVYEVSSESMCTNFGRFVKDSQLIETIGNLTSPMCNTYVHLQKKRGYSETVLFNLYTKKNAFTPQQLRLRDVKALNESFFDPSKKTIFITHGNWESIESGGTQDIKNALLYFDDVNVVAVDWSHYADQLCYFHNMKEVPLIGVYLSGFVRFLVAQGASPFKIHLVGYSLGAHICGFAGKILKRTGIKIARITGLDPAGPGFEGLPRSSRLATTDAEFVDCIHTNAGLYGLREPICRADYYPNGGEDQPGCPWYYFCLCHHIRSMKYFAESIDPTHHFYAKKCKVSKGVPDECAEDIVADMGYYANRKYKGSYYLETKDRWPFANEIELVQKSHKKSKISGSAKLSTLDVTLPESCSTATTNTSRCLNRDTNTQGNSGESATCTRRKDLSRKLRNKESASVPLLVTPWDEHKLDAEALQKYDVHLKAINPILTNLEDSILFYLYTKTTARSPQQLKLNDTASLESSLFDASKKTIVVSHGYLNSVNSEITQKIKNALLKYEDDNVIGVDWSAYSTNILYPWVVGEVPEVGNYVGEFVDFLVRHGALPSKIHLVGHSLGAHVSGFAGKLLIGRGHKVGRVTGLDPALPGFWWDYDNSRLAPTDGFFVDCIHTCGGLLGFDTPICLADFFPNGGEAIQPGCTVRDALGGICSHGRSYEFFAESIDPTHHFNAKTCESVELGVPHGCFKDGAVMGYYAKPKHQGVFYLTTRSSFPFAKNITASSSHASSKHALKTNSKQLENSDAVPSR